MKLFFVVVLFLLVTVAIFQAGAIFYGMHGCSEIGKTIVKSSLLLKC
jgi:hypothetical protein